MKFQLVKEKKVWSARLWHPNLDLLMRCGREELNAVLGEGRYRKWGGPVQAHRFLGWDMRGLEKYCRKGFLHDSGNWISGLARKKSPSGSCNMRPMKPSDTITVLSVEDLDRSTCFYGELLGGRIVHREDGLFVEIDVQDNILRLVCRASRSTLNSKSCSVEMVVRDIESTYGLCHYRSISVLRWEELPEGKILEIQDPDGYRVVLRQADELIK